MPVVHVPRLAPVGPLETEQDASLLGAAAEVFSAGQELILDRIDLLQTEVTSAATRLATSAALVLGASTLLLLGWTLLTAALTVLLARLLPLDAALGVAGSLQVALGALVGGLGHRRMSAPGTFDDPTPRPEATHV